ncbi:3-dehydroquinate synthase II [Ideonella sp.]|uniref:3-dehydroquinate synthase II n=1 Tax=Ideonella sp. TaxID=1929293 RepID=UPI0035AFAF44
MSKLTASATALQDTAVADVDAAPPAAATPKATPPAAAALPDPTPAPRTAGSVQWWFDARKLPSKRILPVVEQSNCTHVVIDHAQHRAFTTAKQKVVVVDASAQLKDLEPGAWVMTREEPLRRQAAALGHQAGLFIDVMDLEREFPYCIEVCERGDDFVVIDIEHATYIPYELLLAKTEGKPTKIFRNVPIKGLQGVVDDINQSLNAFATMEHGIGVVLRTEHAEVIENLSQRIEQRRDTRIQLVKARVEEVQHTGLGHRVCVDCTSMMSVEEGMIVGSTGWGGLFVCSETHYLPHMNLREFRVNAGAVHSYIWGPDDNVKYLNEMQAGAEVLCVDLHGNSRVVTVGRAKIERRPMLKIRCSVSLDSVTPELRDAVLSASAAKRAVTPSQETVALEDPNRVYINAFLQNDWHVRLMGADGKVRHATLVQPGDELLAHVALPGRHTGLRITEHIIEQ